MDRWAAAHGGLAPVVVMPDAIGVGPGQPAVHELRARPGGHLSDVRTSISWVTSHAAGRPTFMPTGRSAGFSYGGTCALQLAVAHPAPASRTSWTISGQQSPHARRPRRGPWRPRSAAIEAGVRRRRPARGTGRGIRSPVRPATSPSARRTPRTAAGQQVVAAAARAAGMSITFTGSSRAGTTGACGGPPSSSRCRGSPPGWDSRSDRSGSGAARCGNAVRAAPPQSGHGRRARGADDRRRSPPTPSSRVRSRGRLAGRRHGVCTTGLDAADVGGSGAPAPSPPTAWPSPGSLALLGPAERRLGSAASGRRAGRRPGARGHRRAAWRPRPGGRGPPATSGRASCRRWWWSGRSRGCSPSPAGTRAAMPALWRRRVRLGLSIILSALVLYSGTAGDVIRMSAVAAGARGRLAAALVGGPPHPRPTRVAARSGRWWRWSSP